MLRNKQQQLSAKLKNAPTDASQVCSSASSVLNREKTLSAQGKVRTDNNLDGNLRSGKSGHNLRVCVLNMRSEPLMPTYPRKARRLLEQDKATVVQTEPFTIQLMYPTGETKQEVSFGIDSGYGFVGFSVSTEKKELVNGKLELRTDVSKKLSERRMYRRQRRSRLWYRKPRFNNRKKEEGWLAPSMRHKVNAHIRLVKLLKRILPVTETVIEVATFDTQKMRNPEISGVEYQQGKLKGYEVKEYLLEKWGRKCAYCGKTDVPLEVEHITPRSRDGTNRVDNLTISCEKCNLEKGNQTAEEFGYPKIQEQAKETLKEIVFMNLVRSKIAEELSCEITYGYITKYNRIKQGLEKSHTNDAFVIAGGENQERAEPLILKQIRRNNRSLQLNRKGFRPSIRRKKHKFQPNDLVRYNNVVCRVKGSHCYGKRVVLEGLGSKNIKNVELINYGKGLVFR